MISEEDNVQGPVDTTFRSQDKPRVDGCVNRSLIFYLKPQFGWIKRIVPYLSFLKRKPTFVLPKVGFLELEMGFEPTAY